MSKHKPIVATKPVNSVLREAIWDEEKTKNLLEELGLIPYYAFDKYSSHRSLKLLFDISGNSPTQGTVLKFYQNYGLDKFNFINTEVPCIDMGEETEDIDYDLQRTIAKDLMESGFDFNRMCDIDKEHLIDSRTCGNMWAVLEEITVSDQEKRMPLTYYSPLRVMLMKKDKPFEDQKAIVFKSNMLRSSKNNKEHKKYYEILPVHPVWKPTPLGRKTIIHVKNRMGPYGRPAALGSIRPQYIEYSNLDTACTIGAKAVTTMLLAFFHEDSFKKVDTNGSGEECEEDEPVDPYEERAEAIRNIITSQGHGHTVAAIPFSGDQPPVFKEINLVRDTDWWKCQIETASRLILQENTVPISLAQGKVSGSDLGGRTGNQLTKEFKMFAMTAVRNEQQMHERFWNIVMQHRAEFFNIESLKGKSVRYTNKVKELLEVESEENNIEERS